MKTIQLIVLLGTMISLNLCEAQNVRIDDGWYYIDGQKFFVKGIGYETNARPGHLPWVYQFDADVMRFDLERIKSAGFNTIRTWAQMTEEELKLVDESGLKILFGIWIDSAGDLANPSFRTSTLTQVSAILEYTKKYPCVIGYLIMNEPHVDQIHTAGAQNIAALWRDVTDLIHQKHAGIPVSFSNAIIGDFIDTDIFDFTAYNAYIYNPVTISTSHGYSGFLHYLKTNRAARKPFLVTEFGLSVSPGAVSGTYTYGGNTESEQASGDLVMYRGLIDAGAQGGAVFQYHDGWWKAGNEYGHEPTPEEWFGLVGFAHLNDTYGTIRPAWSAFAAYNKAIITEPKNETMYTGQIPVELFTTDDVRRFSVMVNDSSILDQNIGSRYFSGTLPLQSAEQARDIRLTFQFFNANGIAVKSETISLLVSKNPVMLPEITMRIVPAALNPGGKHYLLMDVTSGPLFTIEDNRIDYAMHPHIGFDNGTAKYDVMTLTDNNYSLSDYFEIPKESKVTTFGAGFTIRHGTFTKRIYTQQILTLGTWADPIKAIDRATSRGTYEGGASQSIHDMHLYQNYPNPYNPTTNIRFELAHPGVVSLRVFDVLGRERAVLLNEYTARGSHEVRFDASELSNGVYFYQLNTGNFTSTKRMAVLK